MAFQTSITFHQGVGRVTGANFLLEHGDFKALIDCGMIQGSPDASELNDEAFAYTPHEIPFLFVTHAHIDHIGRIPKLVKDGFKGVIFSTPTTKILAEIMLGDSARVAQFKAEKEGGVPLYTARDVERALALWETIPYSTPTEIVPGVLVELKDAGHIIGSSMYVFTLTSPDGTKKRVLFTGDLGNSPSTLIRDTEYVDNVDIAIVDSVYGDRNHESIERRSERFKEVISQAIARGGTVLIPSFSLERTQVILYELNELIEGKALPSIPVFLDSPLAIEITRVYEKITALYNDDIKKDLKSGDAIFEFPKLKETARAWDSKKIAQTKGPKIIIAGAGMSTGGRILHHEKEYLPSPTTTLLLIGYQAPGTLGRELLEGAKEVVIDDEPVAVRARIEFISAYSSHKDSDHVIEYVDHMKETLKKVFVVMGEPKASSFLAQRLRDFIGVEAIIPERGKKYTL